MAAAKKTTRKKAKPKTNPRLPTEDDEAIRETFLQTLASTCNVTKAAKAANVCRVVVYQWRQKDSVFAEQWDEAKKVGIQALEDEAVRRAHEGVVKPVFYQGKPCGAVQEYSDSLLMFMLKAHDPKYREKQTHEHTGADGGPIDTYAMTPEERQARIDELIRKRSVVSADSD